MARQKTPKGAFFEKFFVKTLVKMTQQGYSLTAMEQYLDEKEGDAV